MSDVSFKGKTPMSGPATVHHDDVVAHLSKNVMSEVSCALVGVGDQLAHCKLETKLYSKYLDVRSTIDVEHGGSWPREAGRWGVHEGIHRMT